MHICFFPNVSNLESLNLHSKQVAQLWQRDHATHTQYNNLMTGGVELYCDVLIAVGFICCQVTHDCRHVLLAKMCRFGDFKGWVTLKLNFRLKVTFRAKVYGPLDGEMVVLQLCC